MSNIYHNFADSLDSYIELNYDVAILFNRVKGKLQVLQLTSETYRISLPLAKAGLELACIDLSIKMLYLLNKFYLSKIN